MQFIRSKNLFSRLFLLITLWLSCAVLSQENEDISTSKLAQDLSDTIAEHYISAEKVPAITAEIHDFLAKSTVNKQDESVIADELTTRLQKIDKHFTVQYQTESEHLNNSLPKESWAAKLKRKNLGFTKLEILDGNIGLLEFIGFAGLNSATKQQISSVMSFFNDVDALIIDLRGNGGGSGETVAWLSSYFVEGKVHLNSFYTRKSNYLQKMWTHASINEDHFEAIPLYILTSNETFSAAEEFSYNFKHMGRATIIGEKTKGGANPWRWFSIQGGFRIGIPTTEAINPITQSNWESKGVEPDVESASDDALNTAWKLALQSLNTEDTEYFQRQEIQARLRDLK